MNLSDRQKRILNYLSGFEGYCTIQEIANVCHVSSRTIKFDLNDLRRQLDIEPRFKMESKHGFGVKLDMPASSATDFAQLIADVSPETFEYSGIQREQRIILRLLENTRMTTIETLAAELFVSNSTILKDLKKVEKTLAEFDIQLVSVRNKGTRIEGNEKDIRRLEAKLFASPHIDLEVDYYNNIFPQFSMAEIERIQASILSCCELYSIELADIALKSLMIHLLVSIKRIREGRHIEIDDAEVDLLKNQGVWICSAEIARQVGDIVSVGFDESEIGYISIHLAGSSLQNEIDNTSFSKDNLKRLDLKLFHCLQAALVSADEFGGCCLSEDQTLFMTLFLHMRPAITRARINKSLQNPFLNDIKREYVLAYEVAINICSAIEEVYQIGLDENEVSFVGMHIGAALLRQEKSKITRVVLVCATGIGSSQILYERISQKFPQISVIKVLSMFRAQSEIPKLQPDFVISTVQFTLANQQIVLVSPLLNENDIRALTNVLRIREGISQGQSAQSSSVLMKYIRLSAIHVQQTLQTRDEVIEFMATSLLNHGDVGEDFLESVRRRENFSSTSIGNLTAIPHPFEACAKQGIISIMTLAKPIAWGENEVQIVLLIALNSKNSSDFREVFGSLLSLIDTDKMRDLMIQSESKEELYKLLDN